MQENISFYFENVVAVNTTVLNSVGGIKQLTETVLLNTRYVINVELKFSKKVPVKV